MSTNNNEISGEISGSEKLVSELDQMFDIYAKEMESYRTGNGEVIFLKDDAMFDIYMKLLDKKDKIKALNTSLSDPDAPTDTPKKVENIQDLILNGKK